MLTETWYILRRCEEIDFQQFFVFFSVFWFYLSTLCDFYFEHSYQADKEHFAEGNILRRTVLFCKICLLTDTKYIFVVWQNKEKKFQRNVSKIDCKKTKMYKEKFTLASIDDRKQ